MKSQLYKAALLAALGLAGASAQAQTVSVNSSYTAGDLLVGIYQPGAADTTVLDIGSASSLFNGETWNLSTYLTAAGITLGSGAEYGIIGATTATTGRLIYQTSSDANGAPTIVGRTSFNTFSTLITTIGNNEGPVVAGAVNNSNGGLDWYDQTLNYSAPGGYLIQSGGYQPNALVGSEDTLYTLNANTTGGSETTDLAFNLNDAGTLTYGTVAVPEPTTYGLLGGAGLLVISLRNQFRRKQA